MIYNIPMRAGQPHQRFKVTLSGRDLTFELRWLELYGFFAVDIYEGDSPITQGRGLHPGIDLIAGLMTGLGSIYLDGAAPTVENLGVDNKLRYSDVVTV